MRLFFLFLFVSFTSFAQIQTPTVWTVKVKPETAKVGDEVEVIFSAKIDSPWKLYAAEMSPDIGPIILEFAFKNQKDVQLIGKPKAVKAPKKVFDEIWDDYILIFEKSAQYSQKVKITGNKPSFISDLSFQSCDYEIAGLCVNSNQSFDIIIKTEVNQVEAVETAIKEDSAASTIDSGGVQVNDTLSNASADKTATTPLESQDDGSLWKFLLVAFGAGFASIFMPCIYPIMPMTVSYFTKQKDGKFKAIFYGISIMVIFALMGLLTMALGASFLNALSTHWLPNLIFFVLFIVFGFALLGAFEIVLPHGAVNKIDRLGDKGGLIGIFFMALTLVVVSFSCTVPFVGSLLIGAAGGEVLKPVYGMLAFGLPFALVFGGLAMFPQYLKSLPKSGGWLNELKAVFGFLEFALALKFLSNIDLAYHWNLIHRNIFLVIWIVIAVIIGLYILGFIRLPKDEKVTKYSFSRIGFAALFLGLAVYMTTGVTNKPLGLLSGILPPLPANQSAAPDKMKALPHGLHGYKEIEDALARSKELKKPILIDFTGYACANCRKMEEQVWIKPDVLKTLKEDFVIASLYVDDKKELAKERHYTSTFDNKLKTTIGEKNMDFQMSKYNSNAQPYYVIVDENGDMIIDPIAYTSYENFKAFLEKGKSEFQK